MLSVASFILLGLFLPETCRKIVGNGSVPPPWTSANISDHIRFRNRPRKGIFINEENQAEFWKNYRLIIPNPIETLVILADLEPALLLIALSLSKIAYIPTTWYETY